MIEKRSREHKIKLEFNTITETKITDIKYVINEKKPRPRDIIGLHKR
jgi:hypothetical protein